MGPLPPPHLCNLCGVLESPFSRNQAIKRKDLKLQCSCVTALPHPHPHHTHIQPSDSFPSSSEGSLQRPCRLQGLPASSPPCPPFPVAHVGLQPQQPSNLSQDSNICCPLCLAGTSFLLPASPSLPSFRSLLQCPFLGETCPDTPMRAPCDNTPSSQWEALSLGYSFKNHLPIWL